MHCILWTSNTNTGVKITEYQLRFKQPNHVWSRVFEIKLNSLCMQMTSNFARVVDRKWKWFQPTREYPILQSCCTNCRVPASVIGSRSTFVHVGLYVMFRWRLASRDLHNGSGNSFDYNGHRFTTLRCNLRLECPSNILHRTSISCWWTSCRLHIRDSQVPAIVTTVICKWSASPAAIGQFRTWSACEGLRLPDDIVKRHGCCWPILQ